jgi:acyl-CoA reductase-like NAD-dependent aldehyde dehydrogenase
MSHARPGLTTCSQYDAALHALSAARQRWAETSVNRRLALLRQIKDALAGIAPAWVAAARRPKGCRRAIRWRGKSGWRAPAR